MALASMPGFGIDIKRLFQNEAQALILDFMVDEPRKIAKALSDTRKAATPAPSGKNARKCWGSFVAFLRP